MPLALDQGIGTVVWSPLAMGRLGGKIRRGQAPPDVSRLKHARTAQIAINWVLQRPSVATVILGARDESATVFRHAHGDKPRLKAIR